MYYQDDVVEDVRSRSDIVDIIGSYVKLQKRGANYVGLCPFHGEKTASFSVNGAKQFYHCFGCGVGGNVFTFLMSYENYTFPEALKYLAERAGVQLPEAEYTDEMRKNADFKKRLLDVHKAAAKFYVYSLRSERGRQAYDYLKNRGLSDETITKFGLGYSDKFSDALYSYLKKEGFDDDLLKQSGIILYDEARGASDRFFNRVMFPIMDINNKVIAFGGRVMGEGQPKYLNSPETKLFEKSKNLYGLNFAKQTRRPYMLLCEGYMDVIALHSAGFTNAVAALGTAFTPLHANVLLRYTKEIVLTFDSDGAGTKAAVRAIPILRNAGIATKVLDMKPYKDPDEFIKALGPEEYQKRIDNAVNGFLFEISVLEKDFDLSNPEQKTRFYRETAMKLLVFKEELELDNYIEALDRIYKMGRDNMRRLVNQMSAKQENIDIALETRQKEKEEQKKVNNAEDGLLRAQRMMLTWLADAKGNYLGVKDSLKPEDFADDIYKTAAAMLYEQYETSGKVEPARIIGHYAGMEEQAEIAAIFSEELREELNNSEREKAVTDALRRIKKNSLQLAGQRAIETNDIAEYQKIIKETANLQKLHISFNAGKNENI